MRLAQQSVEAVVEAGAEAQVGGVAGAVQRAVVVLSRHGQQVLVLVLVVVGRLLEVVLLEGGEQSRLILIHGAVTIQAARATVVGFLQHQKSLFGNNFPFYMTFPSLLPLLPCVHPAG